MRGATTLLATEITERKEKMGIGLSDYTLVALAELCG